jgi:protein tyrosine/serine phosphatase
MLDEGAGSIHRALHLLADPDAVPLVFHCAAGKDRTGVVAALTLSLLGVSDDDIATDYSLSRLGMDRLSEWLRDTFPERAEEMATQPTAFLQSPSAAMHLFLEELRARFGSVDDYVATLDITRDDIERLRANLLEPQPPRMGSDR